MTMGRRLQNRRILITGAAAGIGKACAQRCLAEGAAVALADVDGTALAATAAALAETGSVVAAAFDVADWEDVKAGVACAEAALGGLDGIVNNAGVVYHSSFENIDWTEWDRTLTVNLKGAMHVCRASLATLRASGGGAIVNVASGAGLRPIPDSLAYCASKAGLVMAGRALAQELAADGIRVNTICPGPIDTALFRQSLGGAATLEEVCARNALHRIGTPGDIAAAAAFLLSAEAAFITGSALAVEGGRVLH